MILGDPIILGGSSGPSSSDAILTVTVPTGSAVTATKGGTTLTPTMWVQAADPTLDCALFVIGPSLFDSVNAWTVTAEKDGFTQSKTVTVSTNKQYDVTIYLPIYLYNQGDQAASITGGWEVSSGVANSEYSNSTTNPVFDTNKVSLSLTGGAANKSSAINTKNEVDLTNYSTLNIAVNQSISHGGAYWSVCSNKTGYYLSDSAASTNNYNNNNTTLDISSLTGLYYVFFSILSWENTGGTADLTKVWLS